METFFSLQGALSSAEWVTQVGLGTFRDRESWSSGELLLQC